MSPMRIHYELTDPAGPVVAAGDYPTQTAFLVSHANLGHIIRLLRAGNVVPRIGQKLTIWIDADGQASSSPPIQQIILSQVGLTRPM